MPKAEERKERKKGREVCRGAALQRVLKRCDILLVTSATGKCENRRLPGITQRLAAIGLTETLGQSIAMGSFLYKSARPEKIKPRPATAGLG